MFPGSPADDVRDDSLVRSEGTRDGVLGFPSRITGFDLQHISGIEAGANLVTPSLFTSHVPEVVGRGPREEVPRPTTRGMVTVVQDVHPVGDFPEMDTPRDAVSIGAPEAVDVDLTVPTANSCAGPDPAGTKVGTMLGDGTVTIDLRPEAVDLRWGKIIVHAVPPMRCAVGRGGTNAAVPLFYQEWVMAEGEGYDRCSSCDKEVDAKFFSGGESQRAHGKAMDWSIFSCPPDEGGCGTSWSKTTRQGLAKRDAQGEITSGLTESALVQRAFSAPSDRFKRNFEMIDWGK